MSNTLILLLIAFQLKHFVCDYPLQTAYMLGKFKGGSEWIGPLTAHAGVHAVSSAAIASLFLGWGAVAIGTIDFAVHFIVDRIKASPSMLGRYKPTQKAFWNALGADQAAHHLTHYFLIWLILANR